MARCEDWPCCGHEDGCCPDFDASGNQLNMRCTCGAVLPLNSSSSICDACYYDNDEDFIDGPDYDEDDYDEDDYDEDDYDEPDPGWADGDHETGLASAGWGTDEDYGDFGCEEY